MKNSARLSFRLTDGVSFHVDSRLVAVFVSGEILYLQSLFCSGNERNEEIQENQRIQGRTLHGRIEVFWHPFPDAVSSFSCRAFLGVTMNVRNEVKAQLVREGVTMQEALNRLAEQYGWSNSISNLSGKLQRETLRYKEAVELADVLGYEIIWKKRRLMPMAKEVPIWEKSNLTLEEAAAYSGIGTGKLREITNDKNCNFVLWVGNKRLIKKRLFDKFIEQAYSI